MDVVQNLKDAISSLTSAKRAVLTNFIELSPKISIGVKAYKLFSTQMPTKLSSICKINGKLELVERQTLSVAVVCLMAVMTILKFSQAAGNWKNLGKRRR